MLKLKQITKDYVLKGVPTVHALRGIDLSFRRSEFVAILGASGCGKTTLLNIVGGLDRYTSGDLIIEGKSTKNYKDNDWDTYRNHSIGFVFQSYNLISHQTILSNVELALTISGIKKEERKRRALEALKVVGLEGMEKKRPNQLSGGQMQRVAIARALINNPEILLADEPTGALDSETSVQIMELLKEVSKDRLVIMVTHNPELAEAYATRIVKMSDGLIYDDNNPYEGESEEVRQQILENKKAILLSKGKKKQTSMSFPTALALSLSNLVSKIKRTLLVAVAGSIGIIGVSCVLAVSFGVNNYIDNMQNDMLSQYPITITETTIDTTSLLTGLSNWEKAQVAFNYDEEVGVDGMLEYMMEKYSDITQVKTNEINEDLVRFVQNIPSEDLAALQLDYANDVTNNIFSEWNIGYGNTEKEFMSLNGLTQMYISELMTVEGFGQYAAFVDLFTNFGNELMGDGEYILNQYDIVGNKGHYPTGANELVLVVDENQLVTDLLLGQLGFYTQEEFLNIAKKAVEVQNNYKKYLDEEIDKITYETKAKEIDAKYEGRYKSSFNIDEVINKKFKYYPNTTIWEYDPNPVFSAKMYLTIPDMTGTGQSTTYSLDFMLSHDIKEGKEVLSGSFTLNGNSLSKTPVNFERVEGGNNDVLGKWQTSIDGLGTPLPITLNVIDDKTFEYKISFFPQSTGSYEAAPGYVYSASASSDWSNEGALDLNISCVLKKKSSVSFGALPSGFYYTSDLTNLILEDSLKSDLVTHPQYGLEEYIKNTEKYTHEYNAYVTYKYSSFENTDGVASTEERVDGVKGITIAINGAGLDITTLFGSSLLGSTTTTNTDDAIAALRTLTGLCGKISYDEEGNKLGADISKLPNSINIYPKDFNTKDKVCKYLDKWNEEGEIVLPEIEGKPSKTLLYEDRKELSYTDTIGLIISVIDTLILAITVALIAFTSLSLVVSCFMIAVITYISTMERIKEIGVIRSLGGRKKDVSRLFIAETLIIGLASGIIGIAATYLFQVILNINIAVLGVMNIAALPIWVAGIMVLLSIFLNVISGLIPSMKASHQDPVIALRSE